MKKKQKSGNKRKFLDLIVNIITVAAVLVMCPVCTMSCFIIKMLSANGWRFD